MDTESESVVTTLGIAILIGILLLGILFVFRRVPIYSPRIHRKKVDDAIINWVSLPDFETLRAVGLDAYILLRFLRMFIFIGLFSSFFGLIVLVSIYQYGEYGADKPGMNHYTLQHVRLNGGRLWATMVFWYLFCGVFMWLMAREYKEFTKLRQDYFHRVEESKASQQLYSIRVENIPPDHRSSAALKSLFEEVFPGQVHSASAAVALTALDPVIIERNEVLYRLEKVLAKLQRMGHADHDQENLDVSLVKSNAKLHRLLLQQNELNRHLEAINAEVSGLETKASEELERMGSSSSGFVTFLSLRAFRASQQPLLFDHYSSLKVTAAKSPTDIIWENVSVPLEESETMSTAVRLVYWVGVLMWAGFIFFLVSVSSVDSLRLYWPGADELDGVSVSIISGLIPSLVLVILMNLLPLFFRWVAVAVSRNKSQSAVQLEVLEWVFIYQLVNVYTVTLSGSAWDAILNSNGNAGEALTAIAATLPAAHVFFINVIATQIFIAIPVRVLRWMELVHWVYLRVTTAEEELTARQLFRGPLTPLMPDYDVLVPYILFVVCALLLYWVIAPFLLPFATLFFVVQYYSFKYQAIYEFESPFETGGTFFFSIFKFTMACLLTSSVLNIAFVFIKDGSVQGTLMLPLPLIIYYVWERLDLSYRAISETVAFSRAVDIDNHLPELALQGIFDSKFFRQPALQKTEAMKPYPHRKERGVPLVNAHEQVDVSYWADTDLFVQ